MESDESPANAYRLLFTALSFIPIWHYLLAFLLLCFTFLYNFLEIHFLQDAFSGFRGCPVVLTYNSCSQIYDGVVSKCRLLHGSYLATPWLSSPHIQTVFLNFFGFPPVFSYRRQLFSTSDGGTIALDWLSSSDVSDDAVQASNAALKDKTTPLVVVIPGLTSDSSSAYLKHLAFNTAKRGWNVVISNHRGLGGVSVTSDCFYNAGWTEDIRAVINYLHHEYPSSPIFVVGTSIGANILVKYLGEDGENIPIAGAVAICSPWDLLIGDRFISRRLVQKFYDRALAIGLQGYAQLHQLRYSRLANWEGIKKSRSIRDFDHHATCLVGKYETVDTYYRRCSSSGYVGSVLVPLLCISALDDPVCTKEAIPWDECRANKNIVLATVEHGGHLAFFDGITASSLWWVRALNEFLGALHSSPYMHVQKKIQNPTPQASLNSSVDQGPYINVAADGMVVAIGSDDTAANVEELPALQSVHEISKEMIQDERKNEEQIETVSKSNCDDVLGITQSSKQAANEPDVSKPLDLMTPFRRCISQLSRQNRWSIWFLVYIAVVTSWPLVGSALSAVFRKKLRNVFPAALLKR